MKAKARYEVKNNSDRDVGVSIRGNGVTIKAKKKLEFDQLSDRDKRRIMNAGLKLKDNES